MVIVSQDKNIIANFDNIAHIFINGGSKTTISYGRMSGCSETLGYYATEERAKEVLQEIATMYSCSEMIKIPYVTPTKDVSGTELMRGFIYEMPQE